MKVSDTIRVFVFSSLWLLLVLCASVVHSQVGKDSDLWAWTDAAKHHEAVVEVKFNQGTGAGVVIRVDNDKPVQNGFQGYCLTAYHIVMRDRGRRLISVTYRNGREAQRCKVMAFNKKHDLAVIWAWVPEGVEPIPIADDFIKCGDSLEFAGLGGGSKIKCCVRHFSGVASKPTNENVIFADVPLLPGDSGGPVFNSQRQVAGIISGGWFWWDGGIKTDKGNKIKVTWPARACNASAIRQLMTKIK